MIKFDDDVEKVMKGMRKKVMDLVYGELAGTSDTVFALANRIGISHTVLYGICGKKSYISLYTALKISDYFGVSLDWLMGRSDKKYLEKE